MHFQKNPMFAAAKAMFTFTPTDFILNNSQLWLIRGLSEVSDMLDSSQSNVDRWRHHVHKLDLIYMITFSFLESGTLWKMCPSPSMKVRNVPHAGQPCVVVRWYLMQHYVWIVYMVCLMKWLWSTCQTYWNKCTKLETDFDWISVKYSENQKRYLPKMSLDHNRWSNIARGAEQNVVRRPLGSVLVSTAYRSV